MAEFKPAYIVGRRNEGFYANIPGDKGKRTYAGIAEASHPGWPGWPIIDKHEPCHWNQRIDDPVLEQLIEQFYETEMWPVIQGDAINSQSVATYFYDWFINSGGKAVMRLQEILGVQQTAHFGPVTLAAVNGAGDDLLLRLHNRRIKFYNDHCALEPSDAQFFPDWLRRSNELYNELTQVAA